MFKFFIPKEDKYFDDFNELINNVNEMAQLNKQLFTILPYSYETIQKIKSLEHRCDEVASKIIKRLNKTFITPFDREDILSLTKKIEGISDALKSLAIRIEIYNFTEKMDSADKMVDMIALAVSELASAVKELKSGKNTINEIRVVKDIEVEADTVFQNTLKKIFAEEKDIVTLLKKKEMIEMLEYTVDKCQVCANQILTIYIKNS
ncbi:MAG: DUF47 family protein [bacterium]